MKKLIIDKIKIIESIVTSLEVILKQEHYNLSNPKNCTKIVDMSDLIEKKTILFKKFIKLNQDKLYLEKKYGFFLPFTNDNELNECWNKIVKKCFLLRKLNFNNKILINKHFYLNQRFLEVYASHKKSITYNFNGNIMI